MQGQIKVGGSWNHAAKTIFVKVTTGGASGWHNVTSGWVKVSGVWKKWFLSTFLDNFQRTTSATSLGSPDGIKTWSNIRGAWGIVSNTATANSAASTYPIATIDFGSTDVTILQDGLTPGVGAAFWVTDSNNWWATATNETQNSQTQYVAGSTSYGTCYSPATTNYGTCYNAGNPNYGTCTGGGNIYFGTCSTPGNTIYGTCYSYVYGSYYNSYTCAIGTNPTTYYSCSGVNPTYNYSCPDGGSNTGNSFSCPSGSNAAYNYTCATGTNAPYYTTTYSYAYTVNVLKSIAGTITTAATFTFSSLVVGLKTLIYGSTGNITVRAYSASGFGSQIGSDQTYTAPSYTATTTHGIILAPANYAQGTTFSSYEVDFITI